MVHVLSSRVLLRPTDPERSRTFYGELLGLPVYREFGTGPERGTVYFLGGGHLEVSGRSETPSRPPCGCGSRSRTPRPPTRSWRPRGRGPAAAGEGALGLVEMWIEDPDGVRIVLVEVPADHPMRYRPGI